MIRRLCALAAFLCLSAATAAAQTSDAEYCGQLSALAYKFVGGSGGDGRSGPDLNTLGAISDCQKGRYDKGIPYLEKRLQDSRVTLPKRPSASDQMSDAEYCRQLSALANKYVSGGGGDGKSFPDLNTVAAINDCTKGDYAKAIPVLEKRLRDSRVTLPKR